MAARKTPTGGKRKARTATAPADETSEAKFSRLATKRVNKALKDIGLIGNLSGSGYKYTDEQVAKIDSLLRDKVKATMARFDKTAKASGESITI